MNKVLFKKISKGISDYLPENVVDACTSLIIQHKVQLKITQPRKSRHGSYQSPRNGRGHLITVNGSLNQYAFLITLIHELAHLIVWEKYKDFAAPHGQEWKTAFQELMLPFLTKEIFPEQLCFLLVKHMQNPSASSDRDVRLKKELHKYDCKVEMEDLGLVLLDDLAFGSDFVMEDGRIFKKIRLLRKYFLCTEISTNTNFRINGLAKVKPLLNNKNEG